MPNWRRAHVPGGTFFFTVVTEGRAPILGEPAARTLLGQTMRRCRERFPFQTNAIVLLPDHLHCIWTLPRGDQHFSTRWAWIKKEFTKAWIALGGREQTPTFGRTRDGRRGVWQPKFWEHTLSDEDDFERHFDYIHFNPVKHGYVEQPRQWQWSSFHRWVAAGVYPEGWGSNRQQIEARFAEIEHSVGE